MTVSVYKTRGHEEFYSDSNDKDLEIKRRMEEIYAETATISQSFWNTASIDERFWAGDQSLWNEIYSHIPTSRRKQFNFNKIRRVINMITGYQRRNRKSTVCIPQENSDQLTTDQLTEILMWIDNQANTDHTLSGAFEGALVTGLNLLNLWVDYRNDPLNGDIKIDNIGYNGFLIDPFFKKYDLSDCNYIWTRKFLTKKQCASLMPEKEKEIMQMRRVDTKDGKFQFLPENYNFASKDLLAYDEFWYLDYRDITMLIDQESGQQIEWEGPKENLEFYLSKFPNIKKIKMKKQTVRLCTRVNDRVMYDGPNPYGLDKYPFVPVMAYHSPDLPYFEWRIQGVVRGLRDAQFLYNRRQQIQLDILESQINSGVKVMEGSLVDDRDAFKTGQGQAMFVKKDAPLGLDSVQQFQAPQIPPSMFQMSEVLSKEITEISGVNEELLGSAEDDKAGILSMLRQSAGLTTLQGLFDNLDLTQKLLGQLQIEMIQKNFQPGKIKRILNADPSPEFYTKAFDKYDCQITEGVNTPNQRMMALQQALHLRELGVPVPTKFILEMSNMQRKTELIEQVEEQEKQQAQMEQQRAQVEMMELESRIELARARAKADIGLFLERSSRVSENESMSISRRSEAVLNEIKSVKELENMDITQIQALLEIIERIKGEQDETESELNPVKSQMDSSKSATLSPAAGGNNY